MQELKEGKQGALPPLALMRHYHMWERLSKGSEMRAVEYLVSRKLVEDISGRTANVKADRSLAERHAETALCLASAGHEAERANERIHGNSPLLVMLAEGLFSMGLTHILGLSLVSTCYSDKLSTSAMKAWLPP